MPSEIITTEDLREFKMELMDEIEELLKQLLNTNKVKTWVKSAEVREILKISQGTLQLLRNNKTIPFYQVGGLIFYDLEEINEILLQNRKGKKRT